MKISTRSFTIGAVVMVLTFCLVLAGMNNGWFKRDDRTAKNDEPSTEEKEPLPEGWVEIGGVRRPISDIKRQRQRQQDHSKKGFNWGNSQPIDPNLNPNTRSIKEAVGKKDLSYRLTSMQPAPQFNREEYEKDPQKYLDEVAPGRINQALVPGPDVVPIKRQGKYLHALVQGESVALEAKVEPLMPASFGSMALGHFENKLTSITVRADEQGIARATFTASGGTRGDIDIRAASPVHSDIARWLIQVKKPSSNQGTNSTQKTGAAKQK